MALTLTSNLGTPTELDQAIEVRITGTVPDAIEPGYLFRLGNEVLGLKYFGEMAQQLPGGASQTVDDRNVWFVERGLSGTTIATHTAGTAVLGIAAALVVGDDQDTPAPFAGTGGGVTPGPFLEPTTATPEAIVDWLIDNDFMEPS